MGFRYDASAAALGGFFTLPHTEPLAVQASSVLAPVGGYGSARVENFHFEEIVSFSAGYTDVSGTEHRPDGVTVRETRATAVIENLNILNMIRADLVVSRLTSQHPEGARGAELNMLPLGSHFVNLRIAGVLIGDASGQLQARPDLVAVDEHRRATKAFIERTCIERRGLPGEDRTGTSPFHGEGGKLKGPVHDADGNPIQLPQPRLRLPLFDLSAHHIPGATTQGGPGGTIVIPGFGTITLGEFIVTPTERQLTMIIVQLGSPDLAMLAAGPVRGNGSEL